KQLPVNILGRAAQRFAFPGFRAIFCKPLKDPAELGTCAKPMIRAVWLERTTQGEWKPNDPRLLKVAKKLIRLYDGEQGGLFWLMPESIAALIAHELNASAEEDE